MMALHVVASFLVVAAAMGLARMAGGPYRDRVRTLEEWQRLVRHLEPLIVWKQMPLRQALLESARGQARIDPALRRWVAGLDNRDTDFNEAWSTLLTNMPGLWDEDRLVLKDFGRVLGMSDAESQRAELEAAAGELMRLVGEARRRNQQDGRLYPALVSALGIMVVILML